MTEVETGGADEGSTPVSTVPPLDHLSWSQYSSFADCAQKYHLSRNLDLPRKPKGYFIGGNAVHSTIEEAEATGWWGDREQFVPGGAAHLFFEEQLLVRIEDAGGPEVIDWGGKKSREFPGGEDIRWWRKVGPMMLRRYAGVRQADREAGRTVVAVEPKVRATLASGMGLVGYPDAILNDRVRDYKTGSSYDPGDLGFQTALYEFQRRQNGMSPLRIGEYVFLRVGDGRMLFTVELDPLVELVPVLMDQMERQWRFAQETGVWPYNPGKRCGWCDMAEHCAVGSAWARVKAHGD